ncbi:MAG: histidine kinase [Sediminibacterium sp.]|nr:histidine kinase [Sediminibacterium sp.]
MQVWLRHLLFWIGYYLVYLFNGLYLSESFSKHPGVDLFLQAALSELLLLLVKIGCVYFILYHILPKWKNTSGKSRLIFQLFVLLAGGALINRLIIQQVIWPYIYQETPLVSGMQQIARYLFTLFDLLQIAGITSAIKLYRLQQQHLQHEKNLLNEKLKTELHLLRAQINPHFLFNSLNTLYALALSNSQQTADMLMKLSGILRYLLYEASEKTSAIRHELDILDDYIALQSLRFGKRIQCLVEKKIDIDDEPISPLLLLPVIENAYKHGNTINSTIYVKIVLKQHQLYVLCQNPLGEESVKADNSAGIGLKNLKRQLELVYTKHELVTETRDGQFILNLYIDLSSSGRSDVYYS